MSLSIKASRPDLPPELFVVLEEEVKAVIEENMSDLGSYIVSIYNKHYSQAEIRGLIEFYQTDLGQKNIQIMPVLMQESMSAGQQWGQALGPEIQKRVLERFKLEGVDLAV